MAEINIDKIKEKINNEKSLIKNEKGFINNFIISMKVNEIFNDIFFKNNKSNYKEDE